MSKNQIKPSRLLLIFGLITPWLVLFYLFFKFTLNLPLRDDYRIFITFQKIYLNATSIPEKIRAVFLPENESYPIFMRLIMIGQYHLDGIMNFRHILLFCWLFILAIWLVYWKKLSSSKDFATVFGLWLLNPLNYDFFYRPDVATYQLVAFGFSVFAMYAATEYKRSTVLFKIFFIISYAFIITGSINGIFSSVIIILYFFLKKEKKILIIVSTIVTIQLILLYLGRGNGKSIGITENLLRYNYELVFAYFMSLGGVFFLNQSSFFQILSGILGLSFFSIAFYHLFIKTKDFVNFKSMVFLFSALSLAAIVGLRYNYWLPGYLSIFESRYKLYGITIILIVLSIYYDKFSSKSGNFFILFVSILLLFAGIYKAIFMLKDQQLTQITDAYNVGNGCVNQTYANKFLTTDTHAKFLKEKGAFDFYEKEEQIESLLKPENLLPFSKIDYTKNVADPMAMGDWAKTETPLSRIEAFGNFPKYNYYLIRFNLKNGKKALHFLLPPIQSFRQNLTGSVNQYSKLSHEYYFEIFEGLNPEDAEIYGVNEIKL
ncbi:MAG: hypothetical protein U0V04_10640 [Spirosomataceae bacterium]